MAKKQKILLVEDDKKFGESLAKVLTAEGFECMHAEKPQTAQSLCKVHTFDIAIIDCMLPQMNGVDLAVKIKESVGPGLIIYMMSGIYKDRNFSVSALKKTGAKSFLIKPFEIPVLLKQLKEDADEKKSDIILSDDPLKNLMLQEENTQQLVLKAIVDKQTISGFEIPQVLTSLMAYKTTGRLHLKGTESEFNLYFNSGNLYLENKEIPSGTLKNFVTSHEYVYSEDLVKINESQWTLQKLCELNFLSPHFAEQAAKEFVINDLNALVSIQKYTVAFFNEPPPSSALLIETKEVDDLIQVWVTQVISPTWIKNYYSAYQNHLLKKQSTTQNKLQLFPVVAAHKQVVALMLETKNILEIIAESGVKEEVAYQVLHIMMIYREFTVSLKKVVTNVKAQVERLRNLIKSFDDQDSFEKLGLTANASDMDIKKAYTDFSATLHPDKLVEAPQDIRELSTKVYEQIQEAYNNLKTPERRKEYIAQLQAQKNQLQVNANRFVDQALMLMLRGDITTAEKNLIEAAKLAPHLPRLKVLQAWCGLKTGKMPVPQTVKLLQALPNDERETAVYHYVKGLQNLASGDQEKALISFKNAIAKDANFLPARRELSTLPQNGKKGSGNIFTADLKDVVGLFFKKK